MKMTAFTVASVLFGAVAPADAQTACLQQFRDLRASLGTAAPAGQRAAIGFTLVSVLPPPPERITVIQRTTASTPVLPPGDELRDPLRAMLALGRGAVVGHAVGTMQLVLPTPPPDSAAGVVFPDTAFRLAGDGAQVFNDRAHRDESTAGPFDPLQADRINLEVWATGQVVVTLRSWGSGTLSFFATCGSNRVWTGTAGSGGAVSTFVLSLFAAREPGH